MSKLKISPLLKKVMAILTAAYLLCVVLFAWLAGDQLYFKQAKGNTALPVAQTGTQELYTGNMVEQYFTTTVQRIEKIHVQWGTFYRPNTGTAVIELYNSQTQQLLLSDSFDMAAITECGLTTLTASDPIEGVVGIPLLLRQSGNSLSHNLW